MVIAVGLFSSLLLWSLLIPESIAVKLFVTRTNVVLRKSMVLARLFANTTFQKQAPADVRFSITLELEPRGENSVDLFFISALCNS